MLVRLHMQEPRGGGDWFNKAKELLGAWFAEDWGKCDALAHQFTDEQRFPLMAEQVKRVRRA